MFFHVFSRQNPLFSHSPFLRGNLNTDVVQKVTFYHSGNQVIGADADGSNSWNHTWKGAAAGHYTVTAVAEGSAGQLIASVDNLPVAIVQQTAPTVPVISPAGETRICSGDSVILRVAAQPEGSYQWQKDGVATRDNAASLTVQAAGSYTVVVSNRCGERVSTESAVVTLQTVPRTQTISGSKEPTLCQGNVTLSVPGEAEVTYQWLLNGTVASSTGNAYEASRPGTYTLRLTNRCGTTQASNAFTIYADTLGPLLTLNPWPTALWAPTGAYHTFNVTDLVMAAQDACAGNVLDQVVITRVTSDEAELSTEDFTTNDMVIAGDCRSVQLRAELLAQPVHRVA